MSDGESEWNDAAEEGHLPEPPRSATPRVKARLLREPTVRVALTVAVLMIGCWIYATVSGLIEWRQIARIVNTGPIVQAVTFGEGRISGRPVPVGGIQTLEYEYQGRQYISSGVLLRTAEQYITGQPFPIRIDPKNPMRWSNRAEPVDIREKLMGSVMTGIFALGAMVMGGVMYARYRALWRHGQLSVGMVLEHRQSAMAPRSVAVVCTSGQGREMRSLTVFVPHGGNVPEVGQEIALITNASGTRGIALSNYRA